MNNAETKQKNSNDFEVIVKNTSKISANFLLFLMRFKALRVIKNVLMKTSQMSKSKY